MAAKIAALGRMCGIASEYWDNFGHRHRTSLSTFRGLLTAMGVPWEDPAELDRELAHRRLQPYDRLLAPTVVVSQSARPGRVLVFPRTAAPRLPRRLEVRWETTDEAGRRQTWETQVLPPAHPISREGPDGFRTRLELPLPARLDPGYYELGLRLGPDQGEETGRARLIVAPEKAHLPAWLAAGLRLWGFNVPLYALQSAHNWGMGDLGDLVALTDWAGSLGASFVGINPLHAPAPRARGIPSPYSPTSRLFLSFLYLDLEAAPELAACPAAQAFLASPEFRRQIARLRREALVPYPGVFRLKHRVLEMLYRTFLELHGPPETPRTPRGEEFARYLAAKGGSLAKFGLYQALAGFLEQTDWRRWPRDYQSPESLGAADFRRQHLGEIHLHQYGQWLAATQLQRVCAGARRQGLPFTLYQDLALAADPGGFDTWAHQGLFALGAEIGAPADAFNPRGQSWGIPPLIPWRLRDSGHQFFLDILRANAPPDGMLRLDHVMGLFRLFWIPRGQPATEGAYVYYPARELLAILCLESVRRRALIIGEDLGTVPPAIRRDLSKRGIFSYRVFYFERNQEGGFRPPADYPRRAMATVTTHDLPTLSGFWQGRDVELKRSLNLYPSPQAADADAAVREQDRRRMVAAMKPLNLLPPGSCLDPHSQSCPEDLKIAVLEYLARSQAALLEVRLEEIFNLPEQQNLPGTGRKEHPNWNFKLPLTLEEMRRDPEPARLAARLNRYRGRENLGGGS
jgi:4-alpha-glucanotransferase